MSQFFRALEQAERERTLREQSVRPESPKAAPAPAGPRPAASRHDSTEKAREISRGTLDTSGGSVWRIESGEGGEEAGEVGLGDVEERLVSLLAPESPAAEQYRVLRHAVEQLRRAAPVVVVGITSPSVGDGKTVTATNLAGALAQAPGARVLLIEADLRRPTFRQYLGLERERRGGLVRLILEPRVAVADAVIDCPPFGLSVLPAGRVPGAAYELLKSPRFVEVLEQARAGYDYVILDCPPCVPVPDCRVIEKHVDGFFVVVGAHRTPRKMVEEALRTIEPSKMLGVVFNEDDAIAGWKYRPYGASTNGSGGRRWRHGWRGRVNGREILPS